MTRPVGRADGKGTGGVAAATGRGGAPGARATAPGAGVGFGAGEVATCGSVAAGAREPVHAASVARSVQPSRERRGAFTGAYRWDCEDGSLVCRITLQADFLLKDLKLGDDFEIFRPAARALDVNEPRQIKKLHIATEDGDGEGVRQEI